MKTIPMVNGLPKFCLFDPSTNAYLIGIMHGIGVRVGIERCC